MKTNYFHKLFIPILLILVVSFIPTKSYARQYSYQGSSQETESRYQDVFVDCYINMCVKVCRGYGVQTCDWDTALQNACLHCSQDFIICHGQDMFNYVYSQTANGNYTGEYSNDLYDETTKTIYYRTIDWDSSSATLYVTEIVLP